MFAIYNLQGRHFRDTLEKLNQVHKTPAVQRVQLQPDQHAQSPESSSLSAHAQHAYSDTEQNSQREAIVHALQIMSEPVATIQASLGIVEAWQVFRNQSYHQLPVLDNKNQIVGMLAERNLLRLLVVDGDDKQTYYARDKTVADVMSQQVITADPTSTARRIAKVMMDYHLSALPIVDEHDALLGLVSRSDILRAVINDPPLSLWT